MKEIIILATVDARNGLSKSGKIQWSIEEIDKFIKSKVKNNIVVMSRKYWFSFGRVKNSINFVLNKNENSIGDYCGDLEDLKNLMNNNEDKDVYVIGGSEIIKLFIDIAEEIIITKIHMNYGCDDFLPSLTEHYAIGKCTPNIFSHEENCFYDRIHYAYDGLNIHQEYKYLDLLEKISVDYSEEGHGILFNESLHLKNLGSKKFPLMTTSKVDYTKVFSKLFLALNGNGSNLGFQWRFFGCKYSKMFENENVLSKKEVLGGIDQLKNLDYRLKCEDINDKEVYTLTSINPLNEEEYGGSVCQFIQDNNSLSLIVTLPRVDVIMIHEYVAFYSLLLYIFSARTSRRPCDITFNFGIITSKRSNLDRINSIIKKTPKPFPILNVCSIAKLKRLEDIGLIDFVLSGY